MTLKTFIQMSIISWWRESRSQLDGIQTSSAGRLIVKEEGQYWPDSHCSLSLVKSKFDGFS